METQTQKTNPLLELKQAGQSVWLDYMRRSLMTSGDLKKLVDQDGLAGMTSNPAIFEKAISGSDDYAQALKEMKLNKSMKAKDVYETLAIGDIQMAATILLPVYQQTKAKDGYISMEVSPELAHDTKGTIDEARRLWKSIGKPNVMIKVPATPEGLPAVEQLISEGINVNITLIFARDVYEKVAKAYIAGLQKYAAKKGDLSKVASVASFFVSRIDSAVDAVAPANLAGKVAIANAKLAYMIYEKLFSSNEWQALAKQGAQVQRLLWASTGTKNSKYSDVIYVEELIGRDTVNTMPPATFDAFKDHGKVRQSLTENAADAAKTMEALEKAGVSFQSITDKLLVEAVELFSKPFNSMLAKIQGIIDQS